MCGVSPTPGRRLSKFWVTVLPCHGCSPWCAGAHLFESPPSLEKARNLKPKEFCQKGNWDQFYFIPTSFYLNLFGLTQKYWFYFVFALFVRCLVQKHGETSIKKWSPCRQPRRQPSSALTLRLRSCGKAMAVGISR